jgi:MraZ protein
MGVFSGTFECKMDPKGRILLPAKLKSLMPSPSDQKINLQLGFKKCITLYTAQYWEQKLQRYLANGEHNTQKQQLFRDMTFGMSDETLDAQGRFTLSKIQCDYAGLGGDVFLIGMVHKIEIWNKERFLATLTPLDNRESLEPFAEEFFDQPLPPIA